uniref:F-box/WD repeat-containing protein 10 isoform X2 n=1 Tax=Monopterus albus TaxID=43700 RepID=UPI0009B3C0A3|nr:F-box/WD repeat-containing protein 10-like isoform X2 [Monopterus albus]
MMSVDNTEENKSGLATTQPTESTANYIKMKLAEFSGCVSAYELSGETAPGCVSMCGMCPSCVFAPKPPGFTQRLWKVSDDVKRRFVVELLLRCTNVQVLESMQSVLSVTSWTLFTYARSRRSASLQDYSCRSTTRALDGKPLGSKDMNEMWDWFSSSPNWIKSCYLCRVFSLCDTELLRMISNLINVLLVRQKRGFLPFKLTNYKTNQLDPHNDEDSEDPALMVVPGSSKSMSGVNLCIDFIGCLPVDLSKRILGLLGEHTLRRCQKVCRCWQYLAKQTLEEIKFRRNFQDQIKRFKGINRVSPTYANILEVPIPTKDDEEVDIHPSVLKMKPFEAAYAKIKTKTVQMEERNIYCGAYFAKVLLNIEDPHRVVDYRGGTLMATGSKDRAVHLFYVASKTKVVSVMKGHVASIRAVLLCEDRDLVITASCDTSIRCWNLKTGRCEMVLYGHTGTISCLDIHADTLVSGAKDRTVKVWNLHTGKHFEKFNFKHPSGIRCVKISSTTVYSSCDRGLVKVWDMEEASLLRVIDAHKSSVKCLFTDELHLLSGDFNGQVMAWSINSQAKECLMTFTHPKEVKSLALVYLRVVTGCADGKIRIFNFLTGDCLRDITAEAETGRILSVHFHDNSILVNTTSSVKLYQFAKVFWDYTDSREGGQDNLLAQGDAVSEKPAASLRKIPLTSVGADATAQDALPSQKMHDCGSKKPERAELLHHTRSKSQTQVRERCETANHSVILSEKATCERMKKRGLHHPLTRDFILLRVNTIQKAQCTDEVSINMECNARLRDSWGPHTPQDPLHSVPVMTSASSQNTTNTFSSRDVTTAPDTMKGHHSCSFSKQAQPHGAHTYTVIKRVGAFTTSAKEVLQAPECMLMRSLPNLQHCMKTRTSLPKINSFGPIQRAERIQAAHSDPR